MHFDKEWFLDKSVFREYSLRRGQSIFNEVHQLFPEEANSITGTIYDCFYLDSKIDLFLEKMRQMVERKEDAMDFKAKEHVLRLLRGTEESGEPKVFYRLGESMESRRLRGDKV